MVTAAKINADLLADDAQFAAVMNRAATAVGRFAQQAQKDINNTSKQFDKIAASITGIKGALGTIGTVGGIALLTKEALDSANAIQTLAEQLGLTTDQIQKYQFAAKQTNVSQDALLGAFNNINKLIAEGKLPYQNLNQAIGDIADRMQNAATGSTRAGIAFDTMGKQGKELIPFFLNGKAALQAFGDEAVRIGAVLPQETIQRAVEFKNQMDALGTVISKNFQTGLLDEFTKDSGALRDIYTDPAFVQGVKTLGEAFGVAAKGALEIIVAYQKATTILGAIGAIAMSGGDKDVNQAVLDEMHARLNGETGAGKATPGAAGTNNAPGTSPRLDKPVEKQSQLDKYTASLNAETAAIGLSEKALFEQKAVIEAENAARTDYENHLRASAQLTPEEIKNVQDLSGAFYDLKNKQQEAEKINQEMKSSFMDTVEAYQSGSKTIGQAIKDLILQMVQLLEKELILQPLADAIFGAKGSGGFGIGGLLTGASSLGDMFGSQGPLARIAETGSASFVGPLPSFDSGTPYVPNDMTANIHKGEAVLTPAEAADWRAGGKGDNYYIDATGASKSDVTQLKALIMSLAGPGRVEDRIKIARQRGQNI